MKLLRYGPAGQEKPGCQLDDGTLRDLSGLVRDIAPDTLEVMTAITPDQAAACPRVNGTPRLGPCLSHTGNFIAIGLNYVQHAIETNAPIPDEPIMFNKAPSCISGPNDPVIMPKGATKLDWEVELAFVIGKRAHHVPEAEALAHVFGYMVCNDMSERAFQLERGGQWMKGKCCPTFGPIGPWLVTADEVGDPQTLDLFMEVNGERLQNSNTSDMIFPIRRIVSYLSDFLVLEPGDIVTTGTPSGVGLGMVPERYLKVGDTMRLGIARLGEQRQVIAPFGG